MFKTYDPAVIANSFLKFARGYGKDYYIGQMKLQRLVYFAHGWSYNKGADNGLINVPFQAMPYGPVCLDIYQQTTRFGSKKIEPHFQLSYIDDNLEIKKEFLDPRSREDDKQAFDVVKEIWEEYLNVESSRMSELTHEKDSPWYKTWNKPENAAGKKYREIPEELIKDYFQKIEKLPK